MWGIGTKGNRCVPLLRFHVFLKSTSTLDTGGSSRYLSPSFCSSKKQHWHLDKDLPAMYVQKSKCSPACLWKCPCCIRRRTSQWRKLTAEKCSCPTSSNLYPYSPLGYPTSALPRSCRGDWPSAWGCGLQQGVVHFQDAPLHFKENCIGALDKQSSFEKRLHDVHEHQNVK